MKQVLARTPILSSGPRLEKPFKLHGKASQFAVSGTLTQKENEGRTRVIAYTWKK